MGKQYSPNIALIVNGRGVYSLDTIMGCEGGISRDEKGCYGDCYAAKSAKQYGYDFSKYVKRDFKDEAHFSEVFHAINRVEMPFIRIGSSGDPSGDWSHTLNVIERLKDCKKEFVLITEAHINSYNADVLGILGFKKLDIGWKKVSLTGTKFLKKWIGLQRNLLPP